MATKTLKTAQITLIGCDETVSLTTADRVEEPRATYALDSFKRGNQMKFKVEDVSEGVAVTDTYYVPFHAVDHIMVTETEEEVADRPSPYGCYPDGTACGSVVGC